MIARLRLPGRWAPVLFSLLLSGKMSFIVSGVATYNAIGLVDGFLGRWMSAWIPSWAVACPTAFFVAPLVRRIVAAMTARAEPGPPHQHGAPAQ